MIKLANSELPLGEIIFFRGLFATVLLLPLVLFTGAHRQVDQLRNWAVFWRTVAEVCAAFLFLLALFQIPIANANAILQVVPLMVTAAAAIFLKEVVGWRRWLAIAVGFVGVLIVIRPGLSGFDTYSLVALVAMLFITLRDMTTRVMPRALPALLVALLTAIVVCIAGPIFAMLVAEQWAAPSVRSISLIGGASFLLIGGYLTAIDFMRHGDIAVIAPFRYSVVVWAIIVGFVVWGEVPDLPMVVGTTIIIATGIYTFRRERRLALAAAEAVDI
jgi:drug/metabolite transporter (DMT)-like permease